MRGIAQHIRRPAFLDDLAARHENHPVSDFAREGDFMRDDDHRHAAFGKVAHHVQHVGNQFGVERAGRLVEQDQLGPHRQRACDRHALLLAARKLARIGVDLLGQPDAFQHRMSALGHLRARLPLHADRPLDDVLQHGHVGEQVEVLEHHADVDALARDLVLVHLFQKATAFLVADQLAIHADTAVVDTLQMVDAAQEGALARARLAEQAHHLPVRQRQVYPLEDLQRAEGFAHARRLHHHPGRRLRLAAHDALPFPSAASGPVRDRPKNLRMLCRGVRGRLRLPPRA
jgi:hypothetical protein